MLNYTSFEFNIFAENTYILYLETGEAAIIDPGCSNTAENNQLAHFISSNGLKPVLLLNTHAHIDHVLGNNFVHRHYGLTPHLHRNDLPLLESLVYSSTFYGIEASPSPAPEVFLEDNDSVTLGSVTLKILFAPGHSPGSVCFYSAEDKALWGGDVLFKGSVGRTDLPGGDFDTLARSIRSKLFTLPEDVTVYSGHGEPTTIGFEKKHNPFVT